MEDAATALVPVRARAASERWAARAVLWAGLALAAGQTVVGAVNELTVERGFLNPDIEGSVFQLLSAAVTTSAAVAAAILASRRPDARRRFAVLAALLAFLAVDDLAVVHERLGEALGEHVFGMPSHVAVRMWIVVLLPLLAAVLGLLLAVGRRFGPPEERLLQLGLGLLVAAVVVELPGAVTRDPSFIEDVGGRPETLRYLVEEGLEIGGWALVAGALWLLVRYRTSEGADEMA